MITRFYHPLLQTSSYFVLLHFTKQKTEDVKKKYIGMCFTAINSGYDLQVKERTEDNISE